MKKNVLIKKLFTGILIGLFSYGWVQAVAQDVALKVSATKDTILIGDQLELMLEVEKANGFDVFFPLLEDTITGHIEIVNTFPPDTSEVSENRTKVLQKYTITSFDSGAFEIPPLQFIILSDAGSDTIYSSPVGLTVNTLPVNLDEPIKDIKDIYNAPITFKELIPFILILLGVALLIIILLYVAKKIKAREPILPMFEKPKIPAEVIALRELNKLKAQKLWQQGRVKEYYSILTDIIRVYIEDRFVIMAMEQTSDEILTQFERTDFGSTEEYNMLKKLLYTADLVKFAKADPLADENELHLANAYVFVENTTPKVEVEEQDAKNEKDV